jgi:hypothetical protein
MCAQLAGSSADAEGGFEAAIFLVGADEGTRTPNLRFTKPLLCQLSYIGALKSACGSLTRDHTHSQTAV